MEIFLEREKPSYLERREKREKVTDVSAESKKSLGKKKRFAE